MKYREFVAEVTLMALMSLFVSCTSTNIVRDGGPGIGIAPEVKVGLFLDEGCRGNGPFQWARLLAHSPQVDLALLDGKDIRDGKLEGLDLLLCPGGGGAKQIGAMKPEGFALVKKYVEEGGCYVGICAGSYNAMNREGRFAFLPYDYIQGAHGKLADLAVDFNEGGAKMLGIPPGRHIARYNGGNIMRATEPTGKGDSKVLAVYKSSVSHYDATPYNFLDTPAAVFGQYGKGKVLVTSFHPESYESTHDIALGCIYALTGVKPVPMYPTKTNHPLRVGFFALGCVGPRATKEMLALDRQAALDVDIFSVHEINVGTLRHYDVVVMPDGDEASYKDYLAKEFYKEQFKSFLERGGRIVASGNGAKYLPPHPNIQVLPVGESFVKAVSK